VIPPVEMLLLRSLVKGDANSARNRLVDPAFDVNAFLRFAYRHQLATYVYSTLRGMDLVDALPRAVRTSVKASALRERGRIERLVAVQREVAAALVAAGIDVLFLKGPLLSHRYYGSVEARSIADLDILVADPSDLPRVQGLLVQLGFEPSFHVPLSMRLTLRFAHHFEYRRDDLPLDVHWVLQRHFTFALDHARIWKTAVRVSMEDGQTYLATSDEYELVLQILGVITDLQIGKLTLRPVVDIYRIMKTLERTQSWSEFLARREPEHIRRPCVYVLELALEVLDCGEEFASLASLLAARPASLPPTEPAFHALIQSRPFNFRQKLLALRTYETSLPAALAWWLLSLPFRLGVYGLTRRRFAA
jgi:hypothetical protein